MMQLEGNNMAASPEFKYKTVEQFQSIKQGALEVIIFVGARAMRQNPPTLNGVGPFIGIIKDIGWDLYTEHFSNKNISLKKISRKFFYPLSSDNSDN